ncbi:MAG TPA: hypothetical protein VMG08_12880 [Allosphingosinicella sp.]|nr:hypothetical protein [Allosphingosinicella sp.]
MRTEPGRWAQSEGEKPYDVGGFGLALALVMLVGAASWAAVILSVARFL